MIPVIVRCRIPQLLLKMGKTQIWLADQVGISKQQMNDYVSLRHVLGLNKAKSIAEVLGVVIDDLYEWEWRGE